MMNVRRIFVFGAGGHGKVVADILLANNIDLSGFIDENVALHNKYILDLPVAGDSEWLRATAVNGDVAIALAIGNNRVRGIIADKCSQWGIEIITAIHPTAVIARSARVGLGTVVMARAVINPAAQVGMGVIVNTGAVVEHDVIVGDYAHLSPNAATGGAAKIGARAHLGLGAVILPGISVGDNSIIGAGAVVIKDIPRDVIAVGVPARVQRSINDANEQR